MLTWTRLPANTYLKRIGGTKQQGRTARALGIGRRTLYRLLEKYEIADTDAERQLM